jgi:hypothetical protein
MEFVRRCKKKKKKKTRKLAESVKGAVEDIE